MLNINNKNYLQQIYHANVSNQQNKVSLAGLEIATHWSPMRLKIECWRLDFQKWSPAGDSCFVQETRTQKRLDFYAETERAELIAVR